MQFEISDEAAILFAEELYTNLIGRQDPIDAAVAEARKAIYIELDTVEWATPVLFMGDLDVELFHFELAAGTAAAATAAGARGARAGAQVPPSLSPAPTAPAPAPAEPKAPRRAGSVIVKVLAGVGVVLLLLLVLGLILDAVDGPTEGSDDDAGAVTTPATTPATRRPRRRRPAAPARARSGRGRARRAAPRSSRSIDAPGDVADHPSSWARARSSTCTAPGSAASTSTTSCSRPPARPGAVRHTCATTTTGSSRRRRASTRCRVSSWNSGTGPYDIEVVPVPPDDVVDLAPGDTVAGGAHHVR